MDRDGKFYIHTTEYLLFRTHLCMQCTLLVFIYACQKSPKSYILSSGGVRYHLSLFVGVVSAGCAWEIVNKRRHRTKLSPLDCEYLNLISLPFLVIIYQDGECVISNSEFAREGKLKVLKTSPFVDLIPTELHSTGLTTSKDSLTKGEHLSWT
jgi:hypothetical protein